MNGHAVVTKCRVPGQHLAVAEPRASRCGRRDLRIASRRQEAMWNLACRVDGARLQEQPRAPLRCRWPSSVDGFHGDDVCAPSNCNASLDARRSWFLVPTRRGALSRPPSWYVTWTRSLLGGGIAGAGRALFDRGCHCCPACRGPPASLELVDVELEDDASATTVARPAADRRRKGWSRVGRPGRECRRTCSSSLLPSTSTPSTFTPGITSPNRRRVRARRGRMRPARLRRARARPPQHAPPRGRAGANGTGLNAPPRTP